MTERRRDLREQRLESLYERYAARVFGYAARRTTPEDAAEVVGEVFLTAWRRLDDIPDDPLPWLLVVARNVIFNLRRSTGRRDALVARLRRTIARETASVPATTEAGTLRDLVVEALEALHPNEREAILLVYWDDLRHDQAAAVAGCTTNAFTQRLHRARRKLSRLIEDAERLEGWEEER